MNAALNSVETRILGCLIEKEMSTPDNYPLSLNALANACNQKSNRDPVINLSEIQVQEGLDALIKKHLVSQRNTSGSRVAKYAHRLSNPVTQKFDFTKQELAILCELMVRGPQTPGELRTRAARLCEFHDIEHVEATLLRLREREDGPYIVDLPRQPGRRESRCAQLLSGPINPEDYLGDGQEVQMPLGGDDNQLRTLQEQVDRLRRDVEEMKTQLTRMLGVTLDNES